jgi:solute carrier family 25 phosphate transporter 3
MAEFIADIFLCPLEATRIRLVSDPTFAKGLGDGAARLMAEEGVLKGFYSGFGPILMKQVPYTMAKFAVQGAASKQMHATAGTTAATSTKAYNLKISLASGAVVVFFPSRSVFFYDSSSHPIALVAESIYCRKVLHLLTNRSFVMTFSPTCAGTIAGVAAAIISHPADTLLSKVNKAGAGGEGSILTRLGRIAGEIGFVKLATVGLGPRCIMIGTLTAGQFAVFDIVMDLTGAEKFHFHNPNVRCACFVLHLHLVLCSTCILFWSVCVCVCVRERERERERERGERWHPTKKCPTNAFWLKLASVCSDRMPSSRGCPLSYQPLSSVLPQH